MTISSPVVANDRTYPVPKTCAIAICLDGCEPEYLTKAIADGLMPTLKRMRETGTDRLAHSVIPSGQCSRHGNYQPRLICRGR